MRNTSIAVATFVAVGACAAFASNQNPAGHARSPSGDLRTSNTDPFAMTETATNNWIVSPSHIMIVVPNAQQLDVLPGDPHAGGPSPSRCQRRHLANDDALSVPPRM